MVVADERDASVVEESGFDGPVLVVPDERHFEAEPGAAAELDADDPGADRVHLRHAGEPKPIRHGHGYLAGQAVQAEHWYGARPGDLCWCTAASGWSKSARNVFVALAARRRAAARRPLRPDERLEILARERVDVLCMAPTEYRAIAKRSELRALPGSATRSPPASRSTPRWSTAWADAAGVASTTATGRPRPARSPACRSGRRCGPARWGPPSWLPDVDRRRRAVRGPGDRADLLPRRPATGPGAPATACARTRTATSGSRAGPTT